MTNQANERPPASQERPIAGIVKDAALAALVMGGLGLFILGAKTVDAPGGLTLSARPGLVLGAMAAVFVGRLLLGVYRSFARTPQMSTRWAEAGERVFGKARKVARGIAGLLLITALLLPLLPFSDRYIVDTATQVLIYVMLGWGLNIVVGLAGLLDLGYVAFYAVGAYSYALLSFYYGLSFWLCLPLAGLFAATFGILLGFPVLRLRGDYLAIVTLGFGEIIRVVLLNWTELTRGPNGISGIPRPSFFGLPFDRRPPEGGDSFHTFFGLEFSSMHRLIFLYYVILGLALLTNAFILRVRTLPLGRAWEALRENEIACRSLGMNPTITKLSAFATGAMFGGFAGAFFAARQGFVSPESFTFMESAVILAIVVLGGMGSQIGVVLATILLIGGFEVFRSLAEYRMLALGTAMVLIMIWRPGGLISRREPTVRLGPALPAKGQASDQEARP